MNSLQMKSLISFALTHANDCPCPQCLEVGGLSQLFSMYTPDSFTDNTLRRVWVWLQSRFVLGSCHASEITFDATSPKKWILWDAMADSLIIENRTFKKLKDILNE